MNLLIAALLSVSSFAACPKNKKEWQTLGPKIFLEKASKQSAPVELKNFSDRLGKTATASAMLFKEKKTEFVMLKAEDKETSLFLTGTMRCDLNKHEPVLVSLAWVKDGKSGMVNVTEQ